MLTYSKYTSKLNALLTNVTLVELSYNQILNHPANLVFDTNFSHEFLINEKILLLNRIKQFLNNDKFCISNDKQSLHDLFKNKDKDFLSKQLVFHDVLLKQIIANILTKVFEITIKKRSLPANFYIVTTSKKAQKRLNRVLKQSNFGVYSKNFDVYNKTTLIYFLKIIKQFIADKKFLNTIVKLFSSSMIDQNSIDKSSKFYQTFCNIYLIKFDVFILEFFKKQINKVEYNLFKTKKEPLKHIDLLISKALLTTKKSWILRFKQIQFNPLKKDKAPILFYVRYLNHFFIGVSDLNLNLTSFLKDIKHFFKSDLRLNLNISNWDNLINKTIRFCGIHKKKAYKIFNTTKSVLIQSFSPLNYIKNELLKLGILQKNKKPRAIVHLINLYTKTILIWYNNFMFCILDYYSKTSNYRKLVYNFYYFVKWSLLFTLKKKHKKSLEKIVVKYWKQDGEKKLNFLLNNDFKTINNAKTITSFVYIYEYIL